VNNLRHNAQDKYERGKKLMSSVGGDPQQMGLALMALHGALEDQIRSLLEEKIPSQRDIIWDSRTTQWKDLVNYGKQYLGFSEHDVRMILNANYYRQEVAHGNEFSWSQAGLKQYADWVGRWCEQGVRPASQPTRPTYAAPPELRAAQPAPKTSSIRRARASRAGLGPLFAVGCLVAALAILAWIILPFAFASKGSSRFPAAKELSPSPTSFSTPANPGNCPGSPNASLTETKRAYVSEKLGSTLRIRAKPTTNSDIAGLVATGEQVRILEGPVCADGYWWRKVESEKQINLQGWVAGGDGSTDWLLPIN